jgi:hypothetical protein
MDREHTEVLHDEIRDECLSVPEDYYNWGFNKGTDEYGETIEVIKSPNSCSFASSDYVLNIPTEFTEDVYIKSNYVGTCALKTELCVDKSTNSVILAFQKNFLVYSYDKSMKIPHSNDKLTNFNRNSESRFSFPYSSFKSRHRWSCFSFLLPRWKVYSTKNSFILICDCEEK